MTWEHDDQPCQACDFGVLDFSANPDGFAGPSIDAK